MPDRALNVALDARPLQNHHRYRGIGQFLFNTLRAVSKIDHVNHYVIYLLRDDKSSLPPLDQNFKYEIKIAPPARPGWRAVIDYRRPSKAMSWVKPADIFFQPDISCGLPASAASVVMLYDLIPAIFKRHYFPRWQYLPGPGFLTSNKNALVSRLAYYQQLRLYKRAARILPISEATRQDAQRLLKGVDRTKLHTIHLAPSITGKEDPNTLAALKITKPYLLYVGSIDYRKNVPALIKAFNDTQAKGFDTQLVLAGYDFTLPVTQSREADLIRHLISSSEYGRDIIIAGYVNDDQLYTLYKRATAFVFPSLYEGFGMPILEAMAIGCPVVALANSSMPEVAGDAAMLMPSSDQLSDGIVTLLTNPKESKRMITSGYKQAKKFSWDKTASEILAVIIEASGKK